MHQALDRAQTRDDTARVLALAWPCVLENLSSTLVNLIDTAMVGYVGAVATAAVGICTTPSWLLNGLMRSLGVGGTALVARAVGAGDPDRAEHTASQVFRVSLIMAALMMAVFFFGAPVIPRLMQAGPDVVAEATVYMRTISLCYLFHFSGMAMGNILRGAGDTRTPMIAGLMANLLNVTGNFLLIYPTRQLHVLGLSFMMPGAGMGVRGAAIASACSMGLAGLFVLSRMLMPGSKLRLHFSLREKWDAPLLRRVAKIAVPAALERLTINVGQIIFAAIITSIGTMEMAAYQITSTIESIGYMPANGFGQAATALVGQNLGAGKPDAAMRQGKRSVHCCLWLLTVIGFGLFFARHWMAGLFTPDKTVAAITASLIIQCALVQPLNAFSIVTSGALNGAGDTRKPFFYALISMWCCRIFFSWLLGLKLGFGVYGVYSSMLIDLSVRSVLLYSRFSRGKWQTLKV